MKVLISRFVTDEHMDLSAFADSSMQLSFFMRRVFRNFDHEAFFRRLQDHHIRVEVVHAPATDIYHQANDEFMSTLRTIRDIYGVNVITLHPQRGDRRHARRYYTRLQREIGELDVTLAYETFGEEAAPTKWISRIEDMSAYFDIMRFPFLKITYDFVHAKAGDALREVETYRDKIEVIHYSDATDGERHIPLGMGEYPVFEFLELLKRIGYDGFLVIEYHPQFDDLQKPDADAVAAYLRGEPEALRTVVGARRARGRS